MTRGKLIARVKWKPHISKKEYWTESYNLSWSAIRGGYWVTRDDWSPYRPYPDILIWEAHP